MVPEPDPDVLHLARPPIEFRDLFYGVASPEDGVIWMVGSYGKIIRSDDGGTSWQEQTSHTAVNLQAIAAWDSRRAVAVGNDGVVLVTDDGGANWVEVEAPRSEIVNKLLRVQVLDGGVSWAAGAGGMILFSQDWGSSWERRSPQEDIAWNDVQFAGADRGWVVGEFGRIMRTENGGLTWQDLESPVERSLMAVAFRDSATGVAVGLDGLIVRTRDGGDSWSTMDSGSPLHLYDVLWDGEQWLVVGDGGLLLSGGAEGVAWAAHALGANELGWHTGAALEGDRLVLVGASQGYWEDGKWARFGS
jgi:photosystem II stability/assembly factor-like uncharacterized protein